MSRADRRRPWIVNLYPLQGRACDVFGWRSCLAHGFGTYPFNYAAPGPHPRTLRFVRFAHLARMAEYDVARDRGTT